MSTQTENVSIEEASGAQADAVIALMLAGASSDPSTIERITASWWQRLFFRRWIGPRILKRQMDTFVAVPEPGSSDLLGYLIAQYTGGMAGTFDWGVQRPLLGQTPEPAELAVLADLLERVLDWVEEREDSDYFYFGTMTELAPALSGVLEAEGMWLPNYQLVQMVAPLPLDENPSLPEDLTVSVQIPARFHDQALDLLHLDYVRPEDESEADFQEDLDAIVALHRTTLRTARFYSVKQAGEPVGFIQQHNWQGELRLLLSLAPALWGSEQERQLVAALPGLLERNSSRMRIRTFSQEHLQTSRESLASLGMVWEKAPWQRWLANL